MADSEWKEVVEGYIRSIWKDARDQRERALDNAERNFLNEFATESVYCAGVESAQEKIDSLGPPAAESYWQLIRDSDRNKLVEIGDGDSIFNEDIVPFVKTRLLLKRTYAGWRIGDIFDRCTGCSVSNDSAGKCFACMGEGELFVRVARRFPWINSTRVMNNCGFCDGEGNCLNCLEEEMPGWRSTVFRRPFVPIRWLDKEKQ